MDRVTLRKGSVRRYADTEESLARLKKMGYTEVVVQKAASDEKPAEDEKPEADKKPAEDEKQEVDEHHEADTKASGRKSRK